MLISEGTPGKKYITSKGFIIEIVRIRESDEVAIHSLSTGHSLVLPGSTEVEEYAGNEVKDTPVVVVPDDDLSSAEKRLFDIVSRIVKDSSMTPAGVSDVLGVDEAVVLTDLNVMTGGYHG